MIVVEVVVDQLVSVLSQAIGAHLVSSDPQDLRAVSKDESDLAAVLPRCVVRPLCTDHCREVVRIAREMGVPITPRGGGSSLEGSSIPAPGSIVVDFSAMNRILEISVEDRVAVVEPGVVYDRLNSALKATGLFFPPSPGGSGDMATIGGMVSTDASGIYSLKYGGTRRWVLGLTVVTGEGEVLRLGQRVPKASAGYSLRDLFIGSEGTLGLVTEVTLALAPVPAHAVRAGFLFEDLSSACETAAEIAAFIPEAAAVELMDAKTIKLLSADLDMCENALAVEVHGHASSCDSAMQLILDLVQRRGGHVVSSCDLFGLRARVTRTIREAFGAVMRVDCAVPLSRLRHFVSEITDKAGNKHAYVFGHAGIGIVHYLMPLGVQDGWSREEALAEKKRLACLAISHGGVISGEHGIGIGLKHLLYEADPLAVEIMKQIKAIFDPDSIMNPDKLIY